MSKIDRPTDNLIVDLGNGWKFDPNHADFVNERKERGLTVTQQLNQYDRRRASIFLEQGLVPLELVDAPKYIRTTYNLAHMLVVEARCTKRTIEDKKAKQ